MRSVVHIRKCLWMIGIVLFCPISFLNGQDKKPSTPVFRVNVDTVYVKVAVTDPFRRYVLGLEKEDFRVYEDKILQTVSHFSQVTAPISVGIVFDVSNSMGYNRNIRLSKGWFSRLLKTRHPEDEFSLITFNDNVKLIESFTDDDVSLQRGIAVVKTGGSTALLDAIYLGLDKIKEGKNEKKALIVITDGEENSSRDSWKEVRESFRELDVPVYGVGYAGPAGYGIGVLHDIVKNSGGRVFQAAWDESMNLIFAELRNQYLLGYMPTNKSRDGKWQKISVQIDPPPGLPKLKIRAKEGYYASKY